MNSGSQSEFIATNPSHQLPSVISPLPTKSIEKSFSDEKKHGNLGLTNTPRDFFLCTGLLTSVILVCLCTAFIIGYNLTGEPLSWKSTMLHKKYHLSNAINNTDQ